VSQDPTGSISEQWIQVDGLQVRFLHSGHGTPLVLVHGLLGYSSNWRYAIPLLAQKYEVFAPDLPGSGLSQCSAELDCSLAPAAGRLLRFLDAVGIGPCDLVGSSYGGATAVIAAGLGRLRFPRLVLVSPANPWSRIGRKRLALLQLPRVGAIFPPLGRWAKPLQGYFISRMYGDPGRVTDEILSSHLLPIRQRGILEHGMGIVRTWSADMKAMERALPSVASIPTLLVWGSRDRTVDPASAIPLSRCFESGELAIIEGAGHVPYEEFPEKFAQIVLDFLAHTHPARAVSDRVVT
jgi:pimeloyl-ACP methyl ester carboxylesterase